MNSLHDYVEPIKKKWVYHFIVSPKTSVIDKPEWYLNQTLKWIYEHIDLVEKEVKKGSRLDSKNLQTKQLFILHMLELTRMRLDKDMKRLAKKVDEDKQSQVLLVHTYNEVVQFIKVIRQLLGDAYKNLEEKHDLMSIFSDQRLFEKIDDVEWEYSKRNIDEITASDNKWDPVLEGDYLDCYKIPRCVDRFLLQIKSISERIDCFTQLDCKFRLIDLQCSLFNKFLKFMKQYTELSPVSKNIISDMFFFTDESTIDLSCILRILNGINFLRLILKERCFISSGMADKLDKDLETKLDKTTNEYKDYFNKLVDKVVSIYKSTDCDLHKFLDFIRPKLSHDIFELVRDESSKIEQARHTQAMLKGLSLGRE